MRLYLVRHGETAWNLESRFQGWADQPLSALGEEQAKALAQRLANIRFRSAYCSDLQRAKKTAEILLGDRKISINQIRDLREMNLGELDGLAEREVLERFPKVVAAWRDNPTDVVMPGGESIQQVQERAWRAVREIWKKHEDDTVLLVGHHTVNKALICEVLGIPLAKSRVLRQPPCSLSVIDFHPERIFVQAVNLNWIERASIWLDVDEVTQNRFRSAKAVILDMDGVVLDSMPYYAAAWRIALAECGVVPPEIEFYRHESEDADLSVRHFFRAANKEVSADTVDKIARRVTELYWSFAHIAPRPGAFEVCAHLKKAGLALALVTGSPASEVDRFLGADQIGLFDAIISRDDVQRGKPNPEPFQAALDKLDLAPEQALAIENAPLGIRSAKDAGLLTIALTSTLPPEELNEADLVLDSLDRLPGWLGIL